MLCGGNIDWIRYGLKVVDPRIAKFAEINEVMAYMPWRLSLKHMEVLLSKDSDCPGWNL